MFSTNHIICLILCIVAIAVALIFLKKNKTDIKKVLNVACIICVLSELIKIFSTIKLVPSIDGSEMYPYIPMQNLPFHLCSLQIIFIFYARFARESKAKEALLAFMYPSCALGAAFALAIPSIFTSSVDVTRAFAYPLTYQYFIYHSMLIVLGIYIMASGQVSIRPKHYLSTLGILGVVGIISLYLNSIFAVPTYQNGELVSLDYTANFFFTFVPPIDIAITEIWQWYLYLSVILVLAIVLITLFYIPVFMRAKKINK